MKKLILTIMVMMILFCSGCGARGTGVGNFLGIPGFIIDPIFYAHVSVDDDPVDMGLREIYAVVYTDASGTVNDDSLWVYFVQRNVIENF